MPLPASFPPTHVSVIEALGSPEAPVRERAAERLARAYWAPVVGVLRARWRLDEADAEDLAQEFFAEALAKGWLTRYEPGRARFRTFLRVCVDRHAMHAAERGRRLKRGGGAPMVPLDDAHAIGDAEVDERFRMEWVRSVFAMALDALRAEGQRTGHAAHVRLFEAYDVEDHPEGQRPTYRELAARTGVPETTVTNHLAWARRAFRRHVLEVLRALAGGEDEFREDARELLGIRVP